MEAESMVADAPSMIAVGALTRTLVDRGDLDEAYAVASAYQLPPGREDLIVQEILLTSLGRVELAMGRHEDASIRLTLVAPSWSGPNRSIPPLASGASFQPML